VPGSVLQHVGLDEAPGAAQGRASLPNLYIYISKDAGPHSFGGGRNAGQYYAFCSGIFPALLALEIVSTAVICANVVYV